MTQYAYSPVAHKIGTQITGRPTQAIQNRYATVQRDEHETFDVESLHVLIYNAEQYPSWGAYWDALNSKDRGGSDAVDLDLLHYIVGDSW